jgi:hypothetical protein
MQELDKGMAEELVQLAPGLFEVDEATGQLRVNPARKFEQHLEKVRSSFKASKSSQ